MKLSSNARVLSPRSLGDVAATSIACVTNQGRLLIFSATQIPVLSRGKGVKLMGIPTPKALSKEIFVVDIMVLSAGESLVVHAGKRQFTLKPSDLAHYCGDRGKRGHLLPRGLQAVTKLDILV